MNAFWKNTSLGFFAAVGTALLTQAASAGAVDPTTLVSKAEVTAVVGQPIVAVTPGGPAEKDDDTGGMLAYCTYHAGPTALIVSVVSFSSATEAKAKTTKELTAARVDGDAKIAEESGLGDRAFWATTANGAGYFVLKGSRVLGLALGGKPAKPPASYRDALRTLAKTALEKL